MKTTKLNSKAKGLNLKTKTPINPKTQVQDLQSDKKVDLSQKVKKDDKTNTKALDLQSQKKTEVTHEQIQEKKAETQVLDSKSNKKGGTKAKAYVLLGKKNEKTKKEKKTYNFENGFSRQKGLLSFKNKSFFESLVNVDAFIGDTYLRSHFSQNSNIYASRNNYDIYDMRSSYAGLKRAIQFLKMQKQTHLIFVGNPSQTSEKCKAIFAKYNIKFFPSDLWVPGFISRNISSRNSTLVIYDIASNLGAKNEAISLNLPIVGFISKYGNMDGVDYPVLLNFEHTGNWYSAIWNAFFLRQLKTKNQKQ